VQDLKIFWFDNASTKLGAIYGISDAVSVSLSRETNMKTFEGGVKYRLIRQNEKFPVDIVGYNVMAVNTDLKKDNYPYLKFNDRLSYLTQALISRRFTDKLSLQLTPSFVHKNLYEPRLKTKTSFLQVWAGVIKFQKEYL
jgi:hypothetical protein